MLGRGVPLIQRTGNSFKARPITIGDPLDKVAAHLLVQSVSPKARTACGSSQLGNGFQGGIDILIWTVRLLLDINPRFVIFKSDCNNAFNSGYHNTLMDAVHQHLPEASSYCYSLLKDPLVTHFTNFKSKKCLSVSMERGVPQGNPMSGTIFNISRADALKSVKMNHPDIYLLSFHDDDYFIGLPDDIFSAVDSFDHFMEPLGLTRNRAKCELYDPSGIYEDLVDRRIQAQCTKVLLYVARLLVVFIFSNDT
jgi:hypothetical protein